MKFITNQKGFSLTEALISSALLGAVFLSVFMGVQKISDHQNMGAQLQSSELIKNSLYSILSNPTAWDNTWKSSENSIFNCVADNSCAGKSGNLSVVKLANGEVYFKDDGSSGFKANGKQCKYGYEGSDDCFLTAKLNVSFICEGDCMSPLAKVEGNFYMTGSGKESKSISSLNFQLLKPVKTDPCAIGCRTEVIEPKLTSTKEGDLSASDLKIVLIIDNSSSMKAAQEYLNTGLKSLMAKLRDLNIKSKIYIYTTTQFQKSGTNPVADEGRIYKWVDQYGVLQETTTEPNYNFAYDAEVIDNPFLNMPVGGTELAVSSDMSDTDYNELVAQVDKILTTEEGVGTTGGSDEQGLCTVARTLFDKGPNAIFKPGDKTLFLVLSDENDSSESSCYAKKIETRKCSSEYGGQYSAYVCDQDNKGETCSVNRYTFFDNSDSAYKANRDLWFTCSINREVDGEMMSYSEKYFTERKYTGRCSSEPYGNGICNEDDINHLKTVKKECNQDGDVITECRSGCWESNKKKYVYDDTNKSTMDLDLRTTPFENGEVVYENIFKYMEAKYPDVDMVHKGTWGMKYKPYCKWKGYKAVTYQEEMELDKESTSLKDVIKQQANSLFGEDGFTMSLIINDEELNAKAGCSLKGEQSFGTEYKEFANNLSIKGSVSSICSKDYSNALDNISKFAETVASQAKKTITLNEGEKVIKITTKTEEGGTKILSTPEDYTIKGLVVTFKDEFIKSSKYPVEVEIAKEIPTLEVEKPEWMKTVKK